MKNDKINGTKRRAIILDGSGDNDPEASLASETLHIELDRSDISYTHYVLRDIEIAPCTGCLKCWTMNPGSCCIDDAGQKICRDIASSDIVIMITPVTFGGYSSELKKGMDRMIPVLLPFFKKYRGETHHPSRNGREWRLFGVGTVESHDADKEALFQDIVDRNSKNMHSPKASSLILAHGNSIEDIRKKLAEGLYEVLA